MTGKREVKCGVGQYASVFAQIIIVLKMYKGLKLDLREAKLPEEVEISWDQLFYSRSFSERCHISISVGSKRILGLLYILPS